MLVHVSWKMDLNNFFRRECKGPSGGEDQKKIQQLESDITRWAGSLGEIGAGERHSRFVQKVALNQSIKDTPLCDIHPPRTPQCRVVLSFSIGAGSRLRQAAR
jgi:hypothetical protein